MERPPLHEASWRELLARRPEASVYHTPEFHRALRLAGLPCVLEGVERDGRLAALALVLLDRLLPVPLLGQKAFAPAGVLAEDDGSRAELLDRLDHRLRRLNLSFEQYVDHRRWDGEMAARGARTDRHRNFLVDLQTPLEQLRGRYSRAVRRNVAAAERLGFQCRLARGPEELARVQSLLLETSRRVGAPPLPWPLLKAVHHELVPAGLCRVYVALPASQPSRPVATRVELLHGGRAIDWYTGTDSAWADSQVGAWLVDRILADLRERDLQVFDFGGGGRQGEDYGPAEFKRRFGGREIEISRHVQVYHPWLRNLVRRGWRLLGRR
jgi:serine/alanine adding enzyme